MTTQHVAPGDTIELRYALRPRGGDDIVSNFDDAEPETVTLGSIASQYGPVVFDHAGHVEMAGGCGDCHHQHGADRTLRCKECHPLDDAAFRRATRTERFRSCRECHPASLSPSDLSRPALKAAYHRACFRCHREVGGIGEDPKGCTEMCHEKKKVAHR